MSFNEKLLNLRKEKKFSQEELADKLDVSRQSVSKWESGQTYPEMDKLLAICKIFDCSLEELTNDDIKIKDFNKDKKGSFNSIIDSVLDLINKTYSYFTHITIKEFIRCIFIMGVIVLILVLLKIPINEIKHGIYRIFDSLNRPAVASFFNNIFALIIDCAYFGIGILVFFYIFKIGFLDKQTFKEENDNKENEKDENIKIKDSVIIKRPKKREYTIFSCLGSIVMFFIKLFLVLFALPVIASLIIFSFGLAINVSLLFKGIILIGIFLAFIFAIMLNALVLEFIFNILFNKKHNLKRMLIILLIGLLGSGISVGILAIEFSEYEIIDGMPENLKTNTTTYNFTYKDNLIIDDNYFVNFVEEKLNNDEIKIEIEQYEDFMEIYPKESSSRDAIYFSDNKNTWKISNYTKIFIDSLKNKKIYTINSAGMPSIKVYANKETIQKLKDNLINLEEIRIQNEYENDYLNRQNEELINEKERLEKELETIKEQNNELQEKIDEYKNKINSLIE